LSPEINATSLLAGSLHCGSPSPGYGCATVAASAPAGLQVMQPAASPQIEPSIACSLSENITKPVSTYPLGRRGWSSDSWMPLQTTHLLNEAKNSATLGIQWGRKQEERKESTEGETEHWIATESQGPAE